MYICNQRNHTSFATFYYYEDCNRKEGLLKKKRWLETMEKYGKRRVVHFRIDETAWDRLVQVAELFNLRPSQYVKALLYKDLGILNVPLDRRRRAWKRKLRKEI
jgi:hypothetical protein